MIDSIIEEAVEFARRKWDITPRLLQPAIDISDSIHPRFPLVQVAVLLMCKEPLYRGKAKGSRLSVVWFVEDEEFKAKSLAAVIKNGIQDVPWDEWAEDFNL